MKEEAEKIERIFSSRVNSAVTAANLVRCGDGIAIHSANACLGEMAMIFYPAATQHLKKLYISDLKRNSIENIIGFDELFTNDLVEIQKLSKLQQKSHVFFNEEKIVENYRRIKRQMQAYRVNVIFSSSFMCLTLAAPTWMINIELYFCFVYTSNRNSRHFNSAANLSTMHLQKILF